MSPIITPPPDNRINFKNISPPERVGTPESGVIDSTTYRRIKKRTIAVPSFKRLSPSIMVVILLDAPKVLSKDTTATGSVAEIIEPYIKEASQLNFFSPTSLYSKIYVIIQAERYVPRRSIGPAKIKI